MIIEQEALTQRDYPRISKVECRELLSALKELKEILQKRNAMSYQGHTMADVLQRKRERVHRVRDLIEMMDSYQKSIPKKTSLKS